MSILLRATRIYLYSVDLRMIIMIIILAYILHETMLGIMKQWLRIMTIDITILIIN
jgi:hypothetical protein